ncbi:hypothetical protein Fcan01_18897 [Folsomia candida]|uniref:Uncharacterized protein n=2 Tax=Folsomia candida TaxID=158441 RepID=A0A226DNZ7_FOLCA|nr:hypothetical protein Fcan01_18897 [Folsomia candida]
MSSKKGGILVVGLLMVVLVPSATLQSPGEKSVLTKFLTDLYSRSSKTRNCELFFVRQGESDFDLGNDELIGGVVRGVGVVAYYNAILETHTIGNSSEKVKFSVPNPIYNLRAAVCKAVIVTVQEVREEWLTKVKE